MTRLPRIVGAYIILAAVCAAAACGSGPVPNAPAVTTTKGGDLVVSVRTEPRSFNRLAARDTTTDLISTLMQAKLVRVNKVTQAVEPWLAESWTRDGQRYTLKLRQDAVFSDGVPLTADDVVFTFQAVYDEKVGSALADSLEVDGKKLQVTAIDAHTVDVVFPVPFAPGVRLLDNLPILPKHKLEASLKGGTFSSAWGLSTPASDIVGLGPFVLSEYTPGQRVVFTRNPRYFRKAADGAALPYLDRITVEIIPDQNAELLRLDAGQIDMMTSEITPASYAAIKHAADEGRVQLLDLGVAYIADSLWFNLKPGAFGADPRASWLQKDELRQAISLAVDRKVFADTVFLGAGVPAYGPETEANKKWFWAGTPKTPYDPEAARKKLAAIGLREDRGADGRSPVMKDARGRPARFTMYTQKGRPALERGSAVIRDELKKIGVIVDVVALDTAALIERIGTAKYDAIYFNPEMTDPDPALTPDFWLSSGSAHFWNMGQKTPATAWEKEIDDLMTKQVAAPDEAERQRLFNEVQRVFAEHVPVLYFVAPRVYVAASSRVTNLTPAVSKPQLLWTPDTVAVKH